MVEILKRIIMIAIFQRVSAMQNGLPVVGIFDPRDQELAHAFQYAVKIINSDPDILNKTRILPFIEYISPGNGFLVTERVCSLLEKGVAAIFGPQNPQMADEIQGISDTFSIPHVETRWADQEIPNSCQINLYPHSTAVAKLYSTLLKAWGWRSFGIIYDDDQGLINLQEIIKSNDPYGYPINIKRLHNGNNFRSILSNMLNTALPHIVVHCSIDKILPFMAHARELGMLTSYYAYMFTSFDVHVLDLQNVVNGTFNITTLQITNVDFPEMKYLVKSKYDDIIHRKGRKYFKNFRKKFANTTSKVPVPVRMEAALMYDAVHLFAKTVDKMINENNFYLNKISCDKLEQHWPLGREIIHRMKTTKMDGLTGKIRFDRDGFRTDFEADILELGQNKSIKIGKVSTEEAELTRKLEVHLREGAKPQFFFGKSLKIVTVISPPFCMLKNESEKVHEADLYEGFAIDLLNSFAEMYFFRFDIHLVPDGKHGSFNEKTQSWTGMVAEIINGYADLAVGDLTINYERDEVIDFTLPYLPIGTAILYLKPSTTQAIGQFSFLKPVSYDVWIYAVIAYFVVSIALFIATRISPYETHLGRQQKRGSSKPHQRFTIVNSMWFAFASLMRMGLDNLPRAISTRVIVSAWWFFSLFFISSYIANLAAFLMVRKMDSPLESVDDLIKQSEIKYGVVSQTSTETFFKESTAPTYKKIYNSIAKNPANNVPTESKGAARVLEENGKYALLTDTAYIEYITEVECTLAQVGQTISYEGYGIGTQTDSLYRAPLSDAILKLQEEGVLNQLKEKWWRLKRKEKLCSEIYGTSDDGIKEGKHLEEDIDSQALGIRHVGGIFIILLVGMVISCFVAFIDFLWKTKTVAGKKKIPISEQAKTGLIATLSRKSITVQGRTLSDEIESALSKNFPLSSDGEGTTNKRLSGYKKKFKY